MQASSRRARSRSWLSRTFPSTSNTTTSSTRTASAAAASRWTSTRCSRTTSTGARAAPPTQPSPSAFFNKRALTLRRALTTMPSTRSSAPNISTTISNISRVRASPAPNHRWSRPTSSWSRTRYRWGAGCSRQDLGHPQPRLKSDSLSLSLRICTTSRAMTHQKIFKHGEPYSFISKKASLKLKTPRKQWQQPWNSRNI